MKRNKMKRNVGLSILVGGILLAFIVYITAPPSQLDATSPTGYNLDTGYQQGIAGIIFFLALTLGGILWALTMVPQTTMSSPTVQPPSESKTPLSAEGKKNIKNKLISAGLLLGVGIISFPIVVLNLHDNADNSGLIILPFIFIIAAIVLAAIALSVPTTVARRQISAPTTESQPQQSGGDRAVHTYTAYDFRTKHGTMNRIEDRKEWAIVHDIYEDPNQPYWEVWVRGKKKDHVYSEREAEESMRKYLSGEYT